jgi:RHS repeat-associated protein
MKSIAREVIAFSLLAFAPSITVAQVTPGIPKFGSFDGGPMDAINLGNLNSHIDIPIFHKPGRGLDFTFQISYDNSVWYKVGTGWQPVTSFGWRNPSAVQTGYISYALFTYTLYCGYQGQTTGTLWQYQNWAYVDPFGGRHTVGDSIYHVTGNCPPPSNLPSSFTDIVADGTGFTITATDNFGGITATVYGADGKTINAPLTNAFGGSNSLVDSNGNTISFNGSSFTDTLGMTALTIGGSGTASSPYIFTYTGPSSLGNQAYTMHYSTFTVRTGFACSGVSEYGPTSVALPDYIQLPNSGPKYTFTYEPTPDQVHYPGDITGRLKSITLPTGGSITYAYNNPNDGVNCADGSTINLTRAVSDGSTSNTWSYVRNTTNITTTVTAPQLSYDSAANQTVITFDSALHETSRKIYQGAATGSPTRTINTTWTSSVTPASVITILEDGVTQAETDTTYDPYGNLTSVAEYDWGNNARGPLVRTTSTTYLNDNTNYPLIHDRPLSKTIKDGNGTIKSRTDIAYDATAQYTVCRSTPIPGHNDAGYPCTFYKRGNPTSTTTYTDPVTPSGGTTRNTSDDQLGNVVAADLNCCQRKTWAYSTTTKYAYPDSITRGSSAPTLTTSATYDLNMGLALTATDEELKVTTNSYDFLGRLTDVQRPDSKHVVYAYDDINRTVQVTSPVQGTDAVRQKTYIDGLGRTIKQQILDVNNASYSIVETQYDSVGRTSKVSNPHNSTAQYWTETRFDALGRTTKIIQQDGSQSTFTYSLNTAITTDPSGKQRKAQTDGVGRLTYVFEPDTANGNSLTQQTSYTYNVFDLLANVTQGVQTRAFVYDALARLTDATTPESGHFQYQYNSYSLLTQRTDARGVITTYGYDTLNRPFTISYNVGSTGVPATASVSYTYGTSTSQNNNGRLITMTDGVGSENYTYDLLGNVTQIQKVISGTTYTVGYQYNFGGQLTQVTYPSTRQSQQTIDAIGRLTSVYTGANVYASGLTYNPAFQLTGFNYGNGNPFQASFTYSPDQLQLTGIAYAQGGSTKFGVSYSYGAAGSNNGQILGTTDNLESGRSVTYGYDSLYRLTSAVTAGSTNYPKWGLSWTYDRYGNRTAQNISSGCVSPMTCPTNSVAIDAATNRLTGSPYVYDANGNLNNDGQNTLTYDAENRLISTSGSSGSATYAYDGNGLRVQKISGGITTNYVFSRSKVIAEYPSSGAVTEYLYLGDRLLLTVVNSAGTYHLWDQLTERMSIDSNGNIVRQNGHFPFGEQWYDSGSSTKWKFTTYERDSESGNDYAMARYYTSRLARFLSTDPLAGEVANPQSLNRYAYVANDAIDFSDPSGSCYNGAASNGMGGDWNTNCNTQNPNCPLEASAGYCYPYGYPGLNPNFAAMFGQVSRVSEQERCYAFEVANGWNPCANPERSGAWEIFGLGAGAGGQLNFDPCAGKTAANLDYTSYGPYANGDTNALEHIFNEHITPQPNKSTYTFNAPYPSVVKMAAVGLYNAYTFTLGSRTTQKDDSFVFTYTFPANTPLPIPGDKWWTNDKIGTTRKTGAGTLTNTLIVDKDCQTVRNSFPGKLSD